MLFRSTHTDKKECIILDHSNTGLSLGLPCTIHYDELKSGKVELGKKKNKREEKLQPTPKKCPKCSFVKPVGVHTCPDCGFTPEVQSQVGMKEGFLAVLERNKQRIKEHYNQRQVWYSGLLYIAAERGYKEGWAAYNFKQKFGTWPDNLSRRLDVPTQEVRSFIKSRQIAFAKSKARSENKFSAY